MAFWKNLQDRVVHSRLEDEALYAAALRSFESGERRKGVWAKALVEAEGNQPRAEALYIGLLVAALKDEVYLAGRAQEKSTVHRARAVIESRNDADLMLRTEGWHYYIDGKQYGPVDGIDLLRKIQCKGILPSDTVLPPGMTKWILASDALVILGSTCRT